MAMLVDCPLQRPKYSKLAIDWERDVAPLA
jgi:hypothetical protein